MAKYCAACGHELATRMEGGRLRPACPQCGHIVYSNPAPVGVVVATHDDKLLLVHRRNPPLASFWAPAAGYIEVDESLEEGCVREAKEETGLDVAIGKLMGVYSQANMGVFLIAYSARVTGGEVTPAMDEVHAVRYFRRDELPYQAAPVDGRPLDLWFHGIVNELFDSFKQNRVG